MPVILHNEAIPARAASLFNQKAARWGGFLGMKVKKDEVYGVTSVASNRPNTPHPIPGRRCLSGNIIVIMKDNNKFYISHGNQKREQRDGMGGDGRRGGAACLRN